MEKMNKTIQNKLTIQTLSLLPVCFGRSGSLVHDNYISYNIEKCIKPVNAGGFGVKGGYAPPCDLRFMEDAALFGEESFIYKLGEARYSDTSPGIGAI